MNLKYMNIIIVVAMALSVSLRGASAEIRDNPVITLEFAYASVTNRTAIQVFASGRAVCSGIERQTITQLSKPVMAKIMHALDASNIVEVTNEKIQERLNAQREYFHVFDSMTTTLIIDLPTCHHRVSCYALTFFATKYPNINELQRMKDLVDLIESQVGGN